MTQYKGIWIWIVAIVVVIALGLWWVSANQSIDTSIFVPKNPAAVTKVDKSSSSVASIAENISGASTFGSWLASTGVAAQVAGKGPYTIFVPTDAAVASLIKGTFNSLSAAEQKRFVQYHVVAGRAIDIDAELSGNIQALSKDYLNFSNTNNIPMVNSGIIIAEYKGSNGIVYVINTPLIPPKR